MDKQKKVLEIVQKVLTIESDAIADLAVKISQTVYQAVEMMLDCSGKIVVTGMGKPGLIARKISATLNSTGTVAVFIHPAEAIHGDLGVISTQDVVVAISNSGETDEIMNLIPYLKRHAIKLISLTGNMKSTLAKHSDLVLDVSIKQEACPIGLAPTASTTASLAMGDALAMALMELKGFKQEDFAQHHPGGNLGRRLLLKVKDIMRTEKKHPIVICDEVLPEVLIRITQAHAGAATIIDDKGRLLGIFTDGDLRRHFQSGGKIEKLPIKDIMTNNPLNIHEDKLASEALEIMTNNKIDELIVVDVNFKPIGLLDVQDLIQSGLV